MKVSTHSFVWIKEVINIVEKEASCELYGILKRPDKRYVTERAYENPKFIEDMVRAVEACHNSDACITVHQVASESFGSIHNHSAYAMIEWDKGLAH